jgi:hypothetical protein
MNTWNEVWNVTDDLIKSTSTSVAALSSTLATSTAISSNSSLIKIKIPLGSALKSIFSKEEVTSSQESLFNQLDQAVKLNITSSSISIFIVTAIIVLGIVSVVVSKLNSRKCNATKPIASAPHQEIPIENVYQDFERLNQCSLDSMTSTADLQDRIGSSNTIEDVAMV